MPYQVNFRKPISIDKFVDTILKTLGLYGNCEKCVYPERIEIMEDNLISTQSFMGKIFCVEGLGEKQGLDQYKQFKVDLGCNPSITEAERLGVIAKVLKEVDESELFA